MSLGYLLQPPVVLSMIIMIAGYYCYRHAEYSTRVQSTQDKHPFFSMCRMDQEVTGKALNQVFTRLTAYYDNIKDSLLHAGLSDHQINHAYNIACKVLDTSRLQCACMPTIEQVSCMYTKSLDAFNNQINIIATKISGSGFRSVDVLARSDGEPSGKYALNQKL